MVTISKVCTRCGKRKDADQFNKRAKAKDGLRQTCKGCDQEIRENWKKNQEGTGVVLPPASAVAPKEPVAGPGSSAPASGAPGEPEGPVEAGGRVIGRIGDPVPGMPRIREVAVDPVEEAEKQMAAEYAALLNKKLSVRKRAILMVKIAKNVEGPTAALALQALRDINNATGVTSRQGSVVELGPLFVMPEGTGKMKMGGGA